MYDVAHRRFKFQKMRPRSSLASCCVSMRIIKSEDTWRLLSRGIGLCRSATYLQPGSEALAQYSKAARDPARLAPYPLSTNPFMLRGHFL